MERITTIINPKNKNGKYKAKEDLEQEVKDAFGLLPYTGYTESSIQMCIDLCGSGSKVIVSGHPTLQGVVYIRYFRFDGKAKTVNVSSVKQFKEEINFIKFEMINEIDDVIKMFN